MPTQQLVKLKRMSPSVRWNTLLRLDLRTREGRTLNAIRYHLTEYVGGNPNIKQQLLIDRAAWITLRILLKERKFIQRGEEAMTLHDDLYHGAWINTLVKIFKQLHPPPEAEVLGYEDILAEIRGTLMEAA